ncbi:hypothetical protein MACK_001355 [Theileria orientalis]|uniref:Guanylate-binding protein N-terminal domain-containing protein n=1 Tax=Theileria orientalis TaxID=68886 RepID=A0A976MCW2_THEOR|nr:hypothetical protein MACK_001355 [Theileria orientalis]
MFFFNNFTTLYAMILFNCINVFVPYLMIKGVIVNTKFGTTGEFKDAPKNVSINQVFPGKSHESISDTHKVDAKPIIQDINQSTQNISIHKVSKGGDNVDPSIDSGFSVNDSYGSLCFAEEFDVGEPLQLVYPNQDHTELLVNPEVLKVLESIPKPIYTVGVIGSVNSGKSLLANLLNDNHFCSNRVGTKKESKSSKVGSGARSKGFKMASTPEPETYGIWLYSKPVKMTRRRLQERLKNSPGESKKSFFSLKNFSANEGIHQSSDSAARTEVSEELEEVDIDQEVNVVFIDIEGFSSHKNIYKYDEALFSMVSSICSEVIYLSNKTLDTSDLHMMEELIKSSLLSKISNLYTLYTGKGEPMEDREEIFEYFLKIFENKNLTFLINEFDYTSQKAFDNLVSLLKAPKRDLSLYEFYLYNIKKKKSKEDKEKVRELKAEESSTCGVHDFWSDEGSSSGFCNKLDAIMIYDPSLPSENESNSRAPDNHIGTKNKRVSLGVGDVMFNSHGYIFHTLFNSVNIATLPSTSKNELVMKMVNGKKNKKSSGKGKNGKRGSDEEYVEHLSTFKSELFQRSTRNPLKKYCVLDGVTKTCHMSGKDLAQMVRFTLSSLSLNRYYKLASSAATVEVLSNIDYKDAFDQYFKVFRSTRLLMIKNDLQETYRTVLKAYINGGDSKKDDQTRLGYGRYGFNHLDNRNKGGDEIVPAKRMPTIPMLKRYSRSLRNQLMDVLVRNYENEAVPEDFDKIKMDLSHGFSRVSEQIEDELYGKLKNHCTNVSDSLLKGLQKEIDEVSLPVIPTRLQFLNELAAEYRKKYAAVLDGVDPNEEDFDFEDDEDDDQKNELLSESDPCDLVYKHYEQSIYNTVGEVFGKNQEMIEDHFYNIFSRALGHFRSKFLGTEKIYDMSVDQALKSADGVIKEAHNVMLTHLGEFHSLEYLVNKYKSNLSHALSEEIELFKRTHKRKCSDKLENLSRHYRGNYRMFLEKYANIPASLDYHEYTKAAHTGDGSHQKANRMPANPEMLFKFRDYVLHLARSEFFKTSCSDLLEIEKRHRRFEKDLGTVFSESRSDNAKLASAALQDEFDRIDAYLLPRANGVMFYSYFRHNAKRYAKLKLNSGALAERFNFQNDSPSPQDAVQPEEILFNTESAKPSEPAFPATTGVSAAASFNINLSDLANQFIRMNRGEIHQGFADAVVEEYLRTRMPRFRKMFLRRYGSFLVLVCSISLMGMAVLSFTLTCRWYVKFLFSLAGFGSYSILVGNKFITRYFRKLQELVLDVVMETLKKFFKLFLMALVQVFDLIGHGLLYVFRRLGFLVTFLIGFTTAIILYIFLYFKWSKSRREEERSK